MNTPAKENETANELKLILPYPPSVNHLYAIFNGRRITSAEGRKFKSDIAVLARRQGTRLLGRRGEVSNLPETCATDRQKAEGCDLADYLIDEQTGINRENEIIDAHNRRLESGFARRN